MKWLLMEDFMPSDERFVYDAIQSSSNKGKYTPTVEFLKVAYSKLNNMFYNGKLPFETIDFKIGRDLKDNVAGRTNADDNDTHGIFKINWVSLNGTLMKTPRSWIETIIHEMIHIDEFINHPEHFDKPKPDEHGEWFKKQANKFKKFGFNITIRDKSDMKTSTDDEDIKHKLDDCVFISFGENPITKEISMIKVSKRDKEYALDKLKEMGCVSATILQTQNLNASRLNNIDIDDVGEFQYNINAKFKQKYGPFSEVKTIDLTSTKFAENSSYKWRSTMTIEYLPGGGRSITT